MTYYHQENFSSSDVAGAVAEATIHDLRKNKSPIPGFPQIHVSDRVDDVFSITLSWNASSVITVSFELTNAEAKKAAKIFKKSKVFDPAIFKRVQSALAKLEREYLEAGNSEHRVKAVAP